MKKGFVRGLAVFLILAMMAGAAAAAETGTDLFSGNYEKVNHEQIEVWANGPLTTEKAGRIPVMEITDMVVNLWKIDLDPEGNMAINFIVETAPVTDHNRFFKTRIEAAVGDGKDFRTEDDSFMCTMKSGDGADEWDNHYPDITVSNPDLDDVLLLFRIVETDSQDNPIQGWEIELPIRLAGDYLTAEAGGEAETHMPVLNDENRDVDIPVYNARVADGNDFSVYVTAVSHSEGGITLMFNVENSGQTRPDVSIEDRKVGGESFDGTWFEDMRDDTGNGDMMLAFSDMLSSMLGSGAVLPDPIETVSFQLIVTGAGQAEPFTRNVTLVFDGAVEESAQAEPAVSLENATVLHLPVYTEDYKTYVEIISDDDYGMSLQKVTGDEWELDIFGDAECYADYEDGYDEIVTHFHIYTINDIQIDWDGWSTGDYELAVPDYYFPDGKAPEMIESIVFSSIEIYRAMETDEGELIYNGGSPDYKSRPVVLLFDTND